MLGRWSTRFRLRPVKIYFPIFAVKQTILRGETHTNENFHQRNETHLEGIFNNNNNNNNNNNLPGALSNKITLERAKLGEYTYILPGNSENTNHTTIDMANYMLLIIHTL